MYMFKYVAKRLGLMLLTFIIIFTMCFVLIKLLPIRTDILPNIKDTYVKYKVLEGRGWITNIEPGPNGTYTYDTVPVLIQYGDYLWRIVSQGDFGMGTSLTEYVGKDLWTEAFLPSLPPTILINIYSSLIGVPIGLALGILAALKKNKWQDQLINIFIILLISLPSIVLAILIQYACFKSNALALPIEWIPEWLPEGLRDVIQKIFVFPINVPTVAGATTSRDKSFFENLIAFFQMFQPYLNWDMFKSMLPAVFALCLGSIAGYARYTRAELSEVLTGEFMLLARTKGLTKGQAIYRHALRNSMVVIFPSILGEFISVLSGSLIIEKIFLINGVGGLYLLAIQTQDYDAFMLLSGFYTLISLVAGIVIDISYGIIDPRIRMGAK